MGTSTPFPVLACITDDASYRIRNYMSKSWFLKIAMEAEPTPLAKTIKDILHPVDPTPGKAHAIAAEDLGKIRPMSRSSVPEAQRGSVPSH